MPDPSLLRRMPHVSDYVAEIMASYKAQARTLASQGKAVTSRCSGCYHNI